MEFEARSVILKLILKEWASRGLAFKVNNDAQNDGDAKADADEGDVRA